MNIHKSHSKSDLIYLFKQVGVNLDKKQNKNEIISDIREFINNKEVNFDNQNDFNIMNIGDLVDHLKRENNEGKIDTIEKEIVMSKCKKIIHFGKCKYNIQGTEYNNIDEIFADCLYVCHYGFIPSVRRACKIHNDCLFKVGHVNAVLPMKIQKQISQKTIIKRANYYNFTQKRGVFIIDFS